MHFSAITLSLGLLIVSVTGTPTPSADNDLNERAKRQGSTFPITGITGTGIHPRLEITTFMKNANQWNLFLLTMQAFKAMPQSNPLSYYGIAGIHGVPNQAWDGVQENPASVGYAVGYCTHSSVLFPAWHRAYMALFEQNFYTQVQQIVQSFPAGKQRNKYAKAASTIRFPYWDWAAAPPKGKTTLPSAITAKTVSVTTPSGKQTIENPLYRYQFDPLDGANFYYSPWNMWEQTYRWPTSNTTSNPSSQENLATAAFTNNRLNLRDSVYNLFTQCPQYMEFSNDALPASDSGCHNSLEAIHDSVHSLAGGSLDGHMTWLWWAAFDPIFWLHHSNVDRLFAMWQTIYPNSYASAQTATGYTFTIAKGSVQDENSPLTPFHKDTTGDFWTSNAVRDWTTFHYTYPEFVDSNGSPAAIMQYVNELYGPSATATAGSVKVKKTTVPKKDRRDVSELEDHAAPHRHGQNSHGHGQHGHKATHTHHNHTTTPNHQHHIREISPNSTIFTPPVELISTSNGSRYEYTANIAAQRFGLDGSFSVYVFFGNFSASPSAWPFDPALVGTYGVFATKGMTHMNGSVAGSVPLTRALTEQIAAGNLANLQLSSVVLFLQEQMQWRVATANGEMVDPDDVPGLQISVVTANATVSADPTRFPVYGEWSTLVEVTHGRAGGLQEDEREAWDVAREEARVRGMVGWGS